MPDLSDLFSALAESAKECEENRAKPVNATFKSKEEAFAYYRKVAGLKPGDLVRYNTTKGIREAIFIKFDDKVMPSVFGWEDNDYTCKGISPLCLLFDDMPSAQAQPDDDSEDDCELENFPRT